MNEAKGENLDTTEERRDEWFDVMREWFNEDE
jgi:hypothetical protein